MELNIINPYITANVFEIFETKYTAGISKFSMFTSIFDNIKNKTIDNDATIIVIKIDVYLLILLFFK